MQNHIAAVDLSLKLHGRNIFLQAQMFDASQQTCIQYRLHGSLSKSLNLEKEDVTQLRRMWQPSRGLSDGRLVGDVIPHARLMTQTKLNPTNADVILGLQTVGFVSCLAGLRRKLPTTLREGPAGRGGDGKNDVVTQILAQCNPSCQSSIRRQRPRRNGPSY